MSINDIYPNTGGDWLKANDLNGRTHNLVIEGTSVVELDGEDKLLLSFENREKKLLCNKTNARTISSEYGDDEATWIGKDIMVFPTTCTFEGKVVPCIRVRMEEELAGEGDDF